MAESCETCSRLVQELEKRLDLHVTYQRDAVEKAHRELSIRLDSMNEFRSQLREQATLLMPRAEYQLHHDLVVERLGQVEKSNTQWLARIWAVMALATVLGGVIGGFIERLIGR